MSQPVRGEVWLADCGLAGKVRPVLVVNVPFGDRDRALLTVVPHTTSLYGSAFEASVPVRWLEAGAFNVQAAFPLPPVKFIRGLGTLDAIQMAVVETVLKRWQGLP